MNLGDLLLGKRVVLRSPLPAEEVARRINAATGSIFNPIASGVSGWVLAGFLSLHWSVPLLNGPQKHLLGRLVADGASTEIRARFGLHPAYLAFFLLWYGFILLMSLGLVSAILRHGPQTGFEALGLLVLTVFTAIPPLMLYLFNRNSDRELQAMLDLLADGPQAVVVAEPRRY
jgi:hypothetical protein